MSQRIPDYNNLGQIISLNPNARNGRDLDPVSASAHIDKRCYVVTEAARRSWNGKVVDYSEIRSIQVGYRDSGFVVCDGNQEIGRLHIPGGCEPLSGFNLNVQRL